jgi:hypothetical protein
VLGAVLVHGREAVAGQHEREAKIAEPQACWPPTSASIRAPQAALVSERDEARVAALRQSGTSRGPSVDGPAGVAAIEPAQPDLDCRSRDQGYPMRTLVKVQLVDVAPVDDPAYPDATAGLRSLAAKFECDFDEVRQMADADELRKFFMRSDPKTPQANVPRRRSSPRPQRGSTSPTRWRSRFRMAMTATSWFGTRRPWIHT